VFVALAIAATLLSVQPAAAARLPTKAESKALRSAFASDKHLPKHAAIVSIEVSSKSSAWARIRYTTPPKTKLQATAKPAKPKTSSVTYKVTPSGTKRTAKKATKKPPDKVEIDLNAPFYIEFKYTASGGEDGEISKSESDQQDPPCVVGTHGTLHSTYSVTQTYRMDLSHPTDIEFDANDREEDANYTWLGRDPFLGQGDEKYEEQVSASAECGGNHSTTCTAVYKSSTFRAGELFFDSAGTKFFGPYFDSTKNGAHPRQCDDGSLAGNHFTTRFIVGAPQMVAFFHLVPFTAPRLGDYAISFPENAATTDTAATSHTTGLCAGEHTSCSDTVTLDHGVVEVSVPEP
jgi:hypothetical protein